MAKNAGDMRLLELAKERGLVTDAQLDEVRAEQDRAVRLGQRKTPTRIAIEKGILSDQDTHDLETEAWIRELPGDLGPYRLVRLLGRGGMAVVFEAQDVSLGKAVAAKLLLPEFSHSDSYLARFNREARIAAKMTHPNAVQVFAAGERDGIHYLVMEYVDGETVSAIIRRRGRIPEREALDMIHGIAAALQEASSLGILHRDIKPGNILVSKWGIAKLADFGIAKEFSDIRDPAIQQSLTMGVVGTPTYMSPEQARGARNLDFRSDIYSLGATLYHMITGELPHYAGTPQETMVRVVSEPPKEPLDALPELSEGTAAVICRMMAKDPARRHATFDELREDLLAARDGRPVSVDYDEAVAWLSTRASESPRAAQTSNPLRATAIAIAVAILGLILLALARSCAG